MNKKGTLIVISGFSGVGKGTVAKRLVSDYGYGLSVSATTREPREGEVDGREYYFKTTEEFQSLIDYNGFIEWAMYCENYYGTPRAYVEKELNEGHNVILEIEVQGAMNVKKQYPDAVLIFLSAPDANCLRERLIGRGTETESVVAKRMKRATEEAEYMDHYEYIVVNGDLDECVQTVHGIINARRCELKNNMEFISQIKADLM